MRDAPVPVSQVEGLPPRMAAICSIDGPGAPEEPPPAYLHLYVYDSKKLRRDDMPPCTDGLCPCGIFYDVEYVRPFDDQVAVLALTHEAGHIMGLCRNEEHGNGIHCRNHGCLMVRSPDLLSNLGFLVGGTWKAVLCLDCLCDLETNGSKDFDARLSFAGPFLLRREDGYSIASLAGWHAIVAGDPDELFDWREALSNAKETIRHRRDKISQDKSVKKGSGRRCFHPLTAPNNCKAEAEHRAEVVVALQAALHDPIPAVQHVAEVWLKHLTKRSQSEVAEPGVAREDRSACAVTCIAAGRGGQSYR